MIPQPSLMVVSGLCRRALRTPAAVFIPPGCAVRALGAARPARKVGAAVRAVDLLVAMRAQCDEWPPAVSAPTGVRRLPTMARSVFAVGVAAPARRNQVLGRVIHPVTVEVIGAQRLPYERAAAPVARLCNAAELVVENEPADCNFAVLARKRMARQVAARPRVSHSLNFSPSWRTSDPGERARALGVPKPPPVPEGQASLFDIGEAS